MPTITYTMRVVRPDEIDADTMADINEDADAQDATLDDKVARWLGGYVSEAADQLSAWLPQGWYAKVDDQR